VLFTLNLWAFWPTLTAMARKWVDDPQYSHGYLVPVFATVLLWLRSKQAERIRWAFDWRGLVYLALSLVIRCANLATWNIDWLDGSAFVIAVGGIFAITGGRRALDWAWPAITFLFFMIPLPYRTERLMGDRLQTLATEASAFLLQLFGLPAVAEGHTIVLRDFQLGVATACSGLSMLLLFVALAVAFASVVRRPLLDRWLLVASAVPIALAVNILRITATGLLHVWAGPRLADLVFHDLAGWLMMPAALGLLWLEVKFLSYVFVDEAVPEEEQRGNQVRVADGLRLPGGTAT
jgi:exosortase